jgi:transcriptional regulator with XRE-family HTH domain
MSINERIKKVAFERNFNQLDLAKLSGVTKQTINQVFSGATNPGLKIIESIVNEWPQLNARWLLTGEGSMWSNETPGSVSEPAAHYGVCRNCDRLEKIIDSQQKLITNLENQILPRNHIEPEQRAG